jgi:5-oxoprolinase (ATP-hydrolysing)/N-methylhydantoinase A
MLRIGIDVGGTFTDLVAYDTRSGRFREHKVLTTPEDPNVGILRVLREIAASDADSVGEGSLPGLQDAEIVHGTTLVANALIQRSGPRTGLLVTRGARDVLETGRENRYDPYDRMLERPAPLVPRRWRRGVPERVLPDGSVREPLDRGAVVRALEELVEDGVESVAVCLLHSYANPAHEQDVRAIAQQLGLNLNVSLSVEIAPEINEWERLTTTAANAYVQPITEGYLGALRDALARAGHQGRIYLMWSDGGIASVDASRRTPIRLLESGPAAGALAAGHVASQMGLSRVIAFDMGGTTAKVCLLHNGQSARVPSFEVGRVHRHKPGSGTTVRVPSVHMLEIGAGGGSIASIDALGLLTVGPRSAGAKPGPACYGLGGTQPTVTDANFVLGYLSETAKLAGGLMLDIGRARDSLRETAARLGGSIEEAASGVRRVVTENMAQAVKLHVTERGEDPRAYAIMAFGGAAPLHAYDVARTIGISRVVIPRRAGVLSSLGFLTAPVGLEVVHSYITPLGALSSPSLRAALSALRERAVEALASGGVEESAATFRYALDMRYSGQGYDIQVPLDEDTSRALDAPALAAAFLTAYTRRYAVPHDGDIEIRACRLRAEGPGPVLDTRDGDNGTSGEAIQTGTRRVWFDDLQDWTDAPVYDLDDLRSGQRIRGPLLAEGRHTTVAIGPHGVLTVDDSGNLVVDIERRPALAVAARRGRLDAVDLEIILARLRAIADEADYALLRTAFSSVVRDGKDYSLVIADPKGACLALPTECMPLFVTSMPRSIGELAKRFPPDTLRAGDIVLTNDPWICAGHKSDLLLLAPIFHRERLVAFVSTILHVPDIGGVLGDFRAWDLYEEGLMIPPVKLYDEGQPNDAVFRILADNVRVPDQVLGDVAAMHAAIGVVITRLREFLDDAGDLDLEAVSAEVSHRAASAFLDRLRALRPGIYHAAFDADGVHFGGDGASRPIHLEAAVRVSDDGLLVDYTGSDPQRDRQPINVPITYTMADTIYALQYMLAPNLPNVGPQFSPVKVVAPAGSVLNARPPVPVYARTRTGVHIATLINSALAEVAPNLVQAGCGHNVIVSITGTNEGRYFHLSMMPKGGMGATGGRDGWDVTVFPTNCTMIPTEIAETLCPIVVDREMTPDSGGPGRLRGGTGQTLTITSRSDQPLTVAIRPNFIVHRAPGLHGGHPGGAAKIELNGVTVATDPVILQPGDVCRVWTAGGGGIGDPRERDPEAVARDVGAGLVSIKAARDVYGVVLDAAGGLELAKTQRLRKDKAIDAGVSDPSRRGVRPPAR